MVMIQRFKRETCFLCMLRIIMREKENGWGHT